MDTLLGVVLALSSRRTLVVIANELRSVRSEPSTCQLHQGMHCTCALENLQLPDSGLCLALVWVILAQYRPTEDTSVNISSHEPRT